MQKVKAKLEKFLDKEIKPSVIITEGFEELYKKECKKNVTTIVNKVYEVLIHGRCNRDYMTQPNEFFKNELPKYADEPCNDLIVELFKNYSTELFKIFETDLLDTIQEIKLETRNNFVEKMLDYIHTTIIRHYKIQKKELTGCTIFNNVMEYDSLIEAYVSLINKENSSEKENKICYNTYLRNLEGTIDELIAELRRYISNGYGTICTKRIRYIYFYVKENILTKF